VIGVGHLAGGTRIAGGDQIRHSWPVAGSALSYDERIKLQRALLRRDSIRKDECQASAPLTISADARAFQLSQERLPDGYASLFVGSLTRCRGRIVCRKKKNEAGPWGSGFRPSRDFLPFEVARREG